jgi:ferredoxin-NADP reductase
VARRALLGRLIAPAPRSPWHVATLAGKRAETASAATLSFDIDGWPGHRAGQHVDVRLTGEDGYQAQRSYSIASAPEDGRLELTVERIDDGEVSPYLVEDMQPGDALELRGPIGLWFTWQALVDGGPLLLVAGGSGVVPLRAMLRHRAVAAPGVPARLLLSARTAGDVIYAGELQSAGGLEHFTTYTRGAPPGWTGYDRRVDRAMLEEVAFAPAQRPRIFVCGPTAFVETASTALVALGHDPERVKTERFGPTG